MECIVIVGAFIILLIIIAVDKRIEANRKSRERESRTQPFVSWGKQKFGDSWPETCERLCGLASGGRTRSIYKLSDSEIATFIDGCREAQYKEQYMEQVRLLEKWAQERFDQSEVGVAERLKLDNPYEAVKGSDWAESMIEADRKSRESRTQPFVSWGKQKFGDSWPETCKRLCGLASGGRTRSRYKLSDSEIKTLSSYVLRDTIGDSKPEEREGTGRRKWLVVEERKCQNCGAPLLEDSCIFCNTPYTLTNRA